MNLFYFAIHKRILAHVTALVLLLCVLFSACTNDPTSKNRKSLLSGTGSNSAYLKEGDFQITLLLKSGQIPMGVDVRGDGSGTLGNLCAGNRCTCLIKYALPNSPERQEEYPVQDVEADFLRCNLTGLAAGVLTAALQIRAASVNQTSNTLPLDFGGLEQAFSSTSPKAYTKVRRYQCRPILWIPYLFDAKVYDPLQSEDPRLSFGVNFYTTHWREALLSFTSGNLARDWDCPASMEDPDSMRDMSVFLENSLNGSTTLKKLFPYDGQGVNGTEFSVAKFQDSLFSIPINPKLQAPGTVSVNIAPGSTPGTNSLPPLGYGAVPDPNSEMCPAQSLIPTGFRWVKLWLFRGTAQPRKYATSSSLIAQVSGSNQGIYCNPGNGFVPGCTGEKSLLDAGSSLSARVVRTSDSPQNQYDVCSRVSFLSTSTSTYAAGSDVWTWTQKPTSWTLSQACSSGYNPLNFLCPSGSGTPNGAAELRNLELVSSENYLYLVTDPQVHSNEIDQLRPVTFVPACDPTSSNCSGAERVVWEKLTQDQASNPIDQPIYPVCVVQEGSAP